MSGQETYTGISKHQAAVNSRGAARVRAAMRPARSLEQISQALTDAAQVRDAYHDALTARVLKAQGQERDAYLAAALDTGAQVVAASVQLRAAQDTLNRILAEFLAVAES